MDRNFLPTLTWREIEDYAGAEGAVVIQPLAAVEQHGPHLPIFTDCLIAQEVLKRAIERLPEGFPVWTLPLLAYGKSTEHAGFPGTITLTAETLIGVLKEVARSVSRADFQRFVILNAHGGNTEIVDFVIRDIRAETGLLAFALHPFLRFAVPEEGLTEDERIYGIHAGDVETSIMLAMAPELVQRELAPASLPLQFKKLRHPPFMGQLNFGWLTEDVSSDGVLGDARTADAGKGDSYLDNAATELAGLLQEVSSFGFES
jgi:creatinine amidohydrolase